MSVEVVNPGHAFGGEIAGVCPHCKKDVVLKPVIREVMDMHMNTLLAGLRVCPNPECKKLVFVVIEGGRLVEMYPPMPVEQGRPELPQSVESPYKEDYHEAGLVLAVSPKASAALSRRLLQHLIREKVGIKKRDLSQEIDELIANGGLPSYLAEAVDAIRNIGNFAAHPIKYTNTGEIVEVEPGEAEWNLDVLEMLFDFYFVQPDTLQARKAALNMKLQQAGKPPMK